MDRKIRMFKFKFKSELGDPEKSGSPTEALGRVGVKSDDSPQIIRSANPRLVQVTNRLFKRKPPTLLLERCHSLCVLLTFLGFLLVIMGLMSFSWDQLPVGIGIAASVSMGFCLIGVASILFSPFTKSETKHHRRLR
jgi:hypothetical protein